MLPMFQDEEVQVTIKGGVPQYLTKPTQASIDHSKTEGRARHTNAMEGYRDGMPVYDELDSGALERQAELAQDIANCVNWKIGDMINESHAKIGKLESYRRAAHGMGKSKRWALELSKVAYAFPAEVRYATVDWHIYRICAQTKDPIGWLNRAIEGGWTSKTTRKRIKEA